MEGKQVTVEKYAHQVVLDISEPMGSMGVQYVINSLEKMLSLASVLRGPARIPLFGLSLINGQFLPVVKLGEIKGQFNRLRNLFIHVLALSSVTEKPSQEDFNDYLHLALKTALEDFNPFESNVSESWFVSKLCVTIVTMKNGIVIQESVKSITSSLNTKLSRIQVAIGSDELEDVFRSWLTERDVEGEQVTLVIRNRRAGCLRVLCDLREAILDPNLLPSSQRFNLNGFSMSLPGRITMTRSTESELIHYELQVVGRLPSSGLCESYVFGLPAIVTPHASSNEVNKQTFYTLCNTLVGSDEYLLARLVAADPPYGYFVLMPGRDCLLAKCLAGNELALAIDVPDSEVNNNQDDRCYAIVQSILATVPHHDIYNPKQFSSYILQSIVKPNASQRMSATPQMSGPPHAAINVPSVGKSTPQLLKLVPPLTTSGTSRAAITIPVVGRLSSSALKPANSQTVTGTRVAINVPITVRSSLPQSRPLYGHSKKPNTDDENHSTSSGSPYIGPTGGGPPKAKKFKEQKDMLKYFRHEY